MTFYHATSLFVISFFRIKIQSGVKADIHIHTHTLFLILSSTYLVIFFQDVRLITFKTIGDVKIDYKPGDVFNIRPRNSKEDIDDLFDIFNTHNIDIKPHYRLRVEEYHDGG